MRRSARPAWARSPSARWRSRPRIGCSSCAWWPSWRLEPERSSAAVLPRRVRRARPRVPDARARGAAGGARARGDVRDLVAVARARRAGRDAVRGGARVPAVPGPRRALRDVRGRGPRDRADARGGRLGRPRRRHSRHPHARAGDGRRARGRAGGDAGSPRVPGRRARVSPLCGGRAAAPHAARFSGLECARPDDGGRAASGARSAQRRADEARPAAAATAARRAERGLCLVGTFPQIEYPAALAGRDPRGRAADVGAAVWPGRSAPGRRSARTRGAVDRSGSLPPSAAGGARGISARSRSACSRRRTAGHCRPGSRSTFPANTRLVEWISYAKTMPECAVVICHAGHGTMARALACGCPVIAVPHCGDMAENAARADWAGVGVSLPVAPARARHAAAGGPPRTGHAVVAHARARAGGVGGGERRGWARGRVGRGVRASVLGPRPDELDELRRVALDDVHALSGAAAQLDHGPLVGDLQRAPDRSVKLPVLELGNGETGPHASSPPIVAGGR